MTLAPKDKQDSLICLRPGHAHFVGVDSDGCVFDSMATKQKQCFIPVTIEHWGLQPIAEYERETHEFVNLYSKWRGSNRFPALVKVFDLLRECEEVRRLGFRLPGIEPLRRWIAAAPVLGEPALEAAVSESSDPVLTRTLAWSRAVNEAVRKVAWSTPPFLFARESLARLQGRADVICVSGTPQEALEREWREADLSQYVAFIAGQEFGPKSRQLTMALSGRYQAGRTLMIGDSPGDLAAARAVKARFYPIVPGHEVESWRRFHDEIADLFLRDLYDERTEVDFVSEFESRLPEEPPWKIRKE